MGMKKAVLLGVAVLAVIIALTAVLLSLTGEAGQSYTEKIDAAEKYLSAGDYDKAIILLKEAIEQEETRPEGYLCLYRAYIGSGAIELAHSTLETGYLKTGSERIRSVLMEQYGFDPAVNGTAASAVISDNAAQDKAVKPILNRELLQFFSSANYNDYRLRYGNINVTEESNQYIARTNELAAALIYYDTAASKVINAAAGEPYADFRPNEIRLDQASLLFGGAAFVSYDELRTMDGISDLEKKDGTITFSADGCRITISCDGNGAITANANVKIEPTGAASSAAIYRLEGKVIDAATGSSLSGARLRAYAGSAAFGDYEETTSGDDGSYVLKIEQSGTHTIAVEKDGYIRGEFQVYISSGGTTREDFTISTKLAEGTVRIVLTWGSAPSDLDSYLIGTTDNGNSVHIDFSNTSARGASGTIAELDVDDRNGFGPETTTIFDLNGVYSFYVADYTGSRMLSSSGAQVRIYKGDALEQVVDVCSGAENGWFVFTIDHGEITVFNTPSTPTHGNMY